MAGQWQRVTEGARQAAQALEDRVTNMVAPSLRLGVTGLSRSGKTVFLAALVHNLVHGGRLPLFKAYAEGRLSSAQLAPQPDDEVPRFPYEGHVRALADKRVWPASTHRIAQLRVTINYQSGRAFGRRLGPGQLHLDLVDYPGEWLLDLPLLQQSYEDWSAEALREAAQRPIEATVWRDALAGINPDGPETDEDAEVLAEAFTAYLTAVRADPDRLASLPPGRFLMPGDLKGSPALTFAPLPPADEAAPGSLRAMMARRYESYKTHVVRPFFRSHFARLDRQVVLVDVLSALNGGPAALEELRRALAQVLACFRLGKVGVFGKLIDRRIDRIVFVATKADHMHHTDHDRLEAILKHLVAEAIETAAFSGVAVDVAAMAAVRATREAEVSHNGEMVPAIVGVPMPGEIFGEREFDGTREVGLFPGDLPDDPADVFTAPRDAYGVTTLRFRPGEIEHSADGVTLSLPHIRLDRVMEHLMGDRLA